MQAIAATDGPGMRRAGRETLSLALIDARNHTLQLLARFEEALGAAMPVVASPLALPPWWVAGHVGWLAERWIARNPQRASGPRCPAMPAATRSMRSCCTPSAPSCGPRRFPWNGSGWASRR